MRGGLKIGVGLKWVIYPVGYNGGEKPTASSLLAGGFPLMAGPKFQPLDGNPTVISILRQLANGLENVSEM